MEPIKSQAKSAAKSIEATVRQHGINVVDVDLDIPADPMSEPCRLTVTAWIPEAWWETDKDMPDNWQDSEKQIAKLAYRTSGWISDGDKDPVTGQWIVWIGIDL